MKARTSEVIEAAKKKRAAKWRPQQEAAKQKRATGKKAKRTEESENRGAETTAKVDIEVEQQ